MTTTQRMTNFRLLAERLAKGEKLLSSQDKMRAMSQDFCAYEPEASNPNFYQIRLVLKRNV